MLIKSSLVKKVANLLAQDKATKPDWELMHEQCLANANSEFEKWERLKKESIDVSPSTRKGSPFRKG